MSLVQPVSQTAKTVLQLRELVTGGELAPGQRVSELAIVERLGVSRTPIRAALARLEQEGLLMAIPSGGFMVTSFSEADIRDAIEVRGTLEGLAARFAAERRDKAHDLAPLRAVVDETDTMLARGLTDAEALAAYEPLNAAFHALIVELADSPVLARQIERASAVPFASSCAFISVQGSLPDNRTILTVAQDQHRCVAYAIEAREGARAEAIMREHARLAARHLGRALRQPASLKTMRGAGFVQRHHSA
jgi:GntR family transcriptional regulator of vanillate catabolism